jgi:type I restriction enzyme, S subunit
MKEGWEIKRLGEIGKVSMCKRVFKNDTTSYGDIPFYKIGTFGKIPNAFITKERYNEFRSKFSFPKKGDILISASGTIGRRVRYDGEPAYFQDSNIVWIDNNEKQVLNDYLYRFYEICNWQSTKGATISRLYNDNLNKIEIPFPPLPEQKRIVAILDKAFAAIAKAKANAEQNCKNAKEIFEGYLQKIFEEKGEGWEEKMLGEMIEIKNGKNQQQVLSDTGKYPIMGSAGNVMGYSTEYICEAGTTIIGRKGNISKPLYIDQRFWNVDTAFGFYPKNENDIDKRFVYYLCLGINFKSMNRGTTIPSLVKSELQTIQIRFPKLLKTQQTIVKKLDHLSTETKKLETIYKQKINDLEELKKSILEKAFKGEL